LVQGEYVEFSLVETTNNNHEFQAVNVCGIKGGKLMCETRRETKVSRVQHFRQEKEPEKEPEKKLDNPPVKKRVGRVRNLHK
jgi:hypothetical protein